MKLVSKEEANLITWLGGQVSLIESTTGKKVEKLELAYAAEGTGVNLEFKVEQTEVQA